MADTQPDSKVVENSKGGRQSALYQYDAFLIEVVPQLRYIMERASYKYDIDTNGDHDPYTANWHLISPKEHMQHAIAHLQREYQHWEIGACSPEAMEHGEADLLNCAIRCLMAYYLQTQGSEESDDCSDCKCYSDCSECSEEAQSY